MIQFKLAIVIRAAQKTTSATVRRANVTATTASKENIATRVRRTIGDSQCARNVFVMASQTPAIRPLASASTAKNTLSDSIVKSDQKLIFMHFINETKKTFEKKLQLKF